MQNTDTESVWLMKYSNIKVVDDKELYRWQIDKDNSLAAILRHVPRGTLTNKLWPEDLIVDAFSKGPLEDFPQTGTDRPIVSERVKIALEDAFPGLAKFFEFKVRWRKKLFVSERYFVCEWGGAPVDCIDMDRSFVIWIMNGTHPIVHNQVLDSRRLPKGRVVSYVEYILYNCIAWEPMRRLCLSEGFTGVQFEKLPVV